MKLNTNAARFFILVILFGVLAIFFSRKPDVRLTLCQDLTILLLDSPASLEWQEHHSIIKGYEDLEVQVLFSVTDSSITNNNGQSGTLQASCFYEYEQDEIGPETFQAPASAYSTYPSKMILNKKSVDKNILHKSITQVMKQQGKDAIKKLKL